jgi:hypothetical protein
VISELLFQTRQPFRVVGDRSDVFLEHDLRRRGGTDHFAEPAEVGWVPGDPACVPDSVPQEQGCQPKLRGLQTTDGLCTRSA